jgi:integrase
MEFGSPSARARPRSPFSILDRRSRSKTCSCQWVHAAEQEAGLGRVWPHLLRHAASTRVARSSDPETWRRFMNHADLSQWARYVAGTDERVRRAVQSL